MRQTTFAAEDLAEAFRQLGRAGVSAAEAGMRVHDAFCSGLANEMTNLAERLNNQCHPEILIQQELAENERIRTIRYIRFRYAGNIISTSATSC
jgi:hypothetical protein